MKVPTVFSISCGFLVLLMPCCASVHVTRVCDDRLDESSVANKKWYDEKIVEEQNGNSRSRPRLHKKIWRGSDEVVYSDHLCDSICAVTDDANQDDRYDSRNQSIRGFLATGCHNRVDRE